MEEVQSMDWDRQKIALVKQLNNSGFKNLGVVFPSGIAYYIDGSVTHLWDREHVKKAYNGETAVSDLIISRISNELILEFATPIKKNGEVAGVLVGSSDGNALSDITNAIQFGETGYAYMIDDTGTLIAHPDKNMVLDKFNPLKEVENDSSLQSLAEYLTRVLKEKTGAGKYSFQNKALYAAYMPVSGTDWTIVVTANEDEVLTSIPAPSY